MEVRKFNVTVNCYCVLKMQISNPTSTDTEIWSDKSWIINIFHPRQGAASLSSPKS